ncbi:MAG: CotH kinase family protein [Bacilli bacterium]|nr:CotH kinase family protein [Bacilli bacterium]
MKKFFKVMTTLGLPFMIASCASAGGSSSVAEESKTPSPSTTSKPASAEGSSSSAISSATHVHKWATEWTIDGTQHYHACETCNEKKDATNHIYGEWKTESLGTKINDSRFTNSSIKYRECSACHYEETDSSHAVLPEIRFNFDPADENANFATAARSTDITRPKVSGNITITNAGEYNTTEALTASMKVRGNQTAGFDKKGLQINFEKKQSMLGLNGNQKFKKWVLLADAKDTTVSRTALGLTMCKGVVAKDSNVWYSDFTPVSVYLNNTYWGMYMLAEQKEVKDGRIKLPAVEDATTEIGYNFELDYYATNEAKKGAEGDPTFSISYGNYFTKNSFSIESCLANSGLGVVSTYTMNSDVTDSTAGETEQTNDTNSQQVNFMKNKLQALFTVLAEGSKNKAAKDINSSNQVVNASSGTTVRQAIEKHFDLNAWAEGFIINAVCLPPDVGYSSFFMSYDNSPTGDKKLRFDVPWDFDSNFGNRRNFITKPDTASSSGGWGQQSYDPYFMDRTPNMWLQLLGKMDWFMNDYVKPKWNAARDNNTFENMVSLANTFYKYYDSEYAKNFAKWKTTQASDSNVSSYFNGDGVNSGELRKPFVNVNERKDAQKETINWLAKRVNYLEKKWIANSTRTPLATIE